MNEEPKYWLDDANNVTKLVRGFCGVCVLLAILGFFFDLHPHHPWEDLWAFYCIYGFFACVILVVVAKEMRKVLLRGEDYYDD